MSAEFKEHLKALRESAEADLRRAALDAAKEFKEEIAARTRQDRVLRRYAA